MATSDGTSMRAVVDQMLRTLNITDGSQGAEDPLPAEKVCVLHSQQLTAVPEVPRPRYGHQPTEPLHNLMPAWVVRCRQGANNRLQAVCVREYSLPICVHRSICRIPKRSSASGNGGTYWGLGVCFPGGGATMGGFRCLDATENGTGRLTTLSLHGTAGSSALSLLPPNSTRKRCSLRKQGGLLAPFTVADPTNRNRSAHSNAILDELSPQLVLLL